MNCFSCGRELPPLARFCPWCGAAQGLSANGTDSRTDDDLRAAATWADESERIQAQEPWSSADLDARRQRFIAALERRRRSVEAAGPFEQGARARERVFALARAIDEADYFTLANGAVLKHVVELATCLDQLPMEVFRRHVFGSRNDFATWVLEVFEDPLLAERMRGIDDPRHLQLEIYWYLAGRELGEDG